MQQIYDIIIAGGGIAGALTAARVLRANPHIRVLLLEKQNFLGGRLQSRYGLNTISPELFDFFDQTLKNDPDSFDLPSLAALHPLKAGVLSGGKLGELPLRQLFSKAAIKILGGNASLKEWPLLEALLQSLDDESYKDQIFSSAWQGSRKSSTLAALEPIAKWAGITDLWSSSCYQALTRLRSTQADIKLSNWQNAFEEIVRPFCKAGNLQLKLGSAVIEANLQDNSWQLFTSQGTFQASHLVVAQPPWEALEWLPKEYWPTKLLNFASKAKPTSVVILSETLTACPETLPDVILVAAEETQVILHHSTHICYQISLDYEVSLQAPDVVKNVKRLKRARKKLQAFCPEIKSTNEHLALIPVAWAGPTAQSDCRYYEKLDTQEINAGGNLFFCGDGYGNAALADENVVRSVRTVSEKLAKVDAKVSLDVAAEVSHDRTVD